ncbi:probable WRKY transcription factor 2 [Lactuca sativa]|uniref:probable WRKY transcription factor 2 n=1 Tax=Lactuca sativa TaxID=4236 RepID=UPI000CD7EF5D|nr:probable WRKY transcription factor 2 [Lactuca sativa]
MAETGGDSAPPPRRIPPMITLPPRSSSDTFLTGISPGPMTLVSNFFSDHYPDTDIYSLSQLLAGVLPSPAAENSPAPPLYNDYLSLLSPEESRTSQTSDPYVDNSSQIRSPETVSDSESGDSKPERVVALAKPASDGYNWRKYGQKQVKASELPRSYYRCTQVNCPVTKKIGHFLDGNTSEIIYSGRHNHEPPQLHKPAVVADEQAYELMPKRRKTEVKCVDRSSSCRVVVTEPKIVVQTRSEIDILDDGFKWRKYGQKVVKGNIYPRSYYRCTYVGCKVRKHVERALSDLKSVVTTYEGRHKHDIPVVVKPSSNNEINFKAEIPFLLQLKEEKIMI